MQIKERLDEIEARIQAACDRAGRKRAEVTLIAVSKTQDTEQILKVIDCGISSFGENKVQELREKHEKLKEQSLEWHMIGHLQGNKVKYLPNLVCLIHSVDRLKIAQEIERVATKHNKVLDILIEVNVAKEDTKGGVFPEEVESLVREISKLPHVNIRGLMTVAPFTEEPEENRKYFRALHKIMVDLNEKNIDNVTMNVLSMGMTGDYEVAVEEGATHVRIGTGIFGERIYD